jgi:hypothetical protein
MTVPTSPVAQPTATALPAPFAPLVGVTSLLVLVQALLAGGFIYAQQRTGLINAHAGIAYLLCAVTLVLAALALARMRDGWPDLAYGSVAMFVLVVAQTAIGSLISKQGDDNLLYIHVPLAMLIFGLTIWLAVRGALARRA